jgi:hypothetical protein
MEYRRSHILAHARYQIPSHSDMLAHKMLLPFPVSPCQLDRAFAGVLIAVTPMGRLLLVVHLVRRTLGTQTARSIPMFSPKIGPRIYASGATPGTPVVRRLTDS